MNHRVAKPFVMPPQRRQRGIAAIEFAFIFPIFFLIFYGIVTYGVIFVAQQSITMAAEEGARAALRYAANPDDRETNAKNAATGNGSAAAWLNANNRLVFEPTAQKCTYDASPTQSNCYTVKVSYNYRQNPLIPLLLGPLMGFAVPEKLSSSATIQID